MTQANARRGEVSLMLEGVEYVMRPSCEAIDQVEEETGLPLIPLLNAAAAGALSLKNAAIVACRFINAWGKKVDNRDAAGANPDRIREMIYESRGGLWLALLEITQVLTNAVSGGYTASGEVMEGAISLQSILSDGSQDLPSKNSTGRRTRSGSPRRTSSGPLTKL